MIWEQGEEMQSWAAAPLSLGWDELWTQSCRVHALCPPGVSGLPPLAHSRPHCWQAGYFEMVLLTLM